MTIAIWCILIAAVLPYVAFSLVRGIDPNQPRLNAGVLEGRSARAYGAHLNGLETFPGSRSAVIVAHIVGGAKFGSSTFWRSSTSLSASAIWRPILPAASRWRSAAFTVGQLVALAIFVSPAFR